MGLSEIIEAAERVGAYEEARRDAFRREFSQYDADETAPFEDTREAIGNEREALEALARQLDEEEANIERLAEEASFLTVDQAVRHRDETVEKLRAHNRHLRTFHGAMSAALDAVETNLDALADAGPDAVEADPEPQFERAHDALAAHDEAIEGVDRNMMILNAYLL